MLAVFELVVHVCRTKWRENGSELEERPETAARKPRPKLAVQERRKNLSQKQKSRVCAFYACS